jgi:hypothetical protein
MTASARNSLILLVLLGASVGVGVYLLTHKPADEEPARLDFDKVGGTVLVYEVDPKQDPSGEASLDKVADALRKRLDPDDLLSLTVRPLGGDRIEIRIPRGGDDHDKRVEAVKEWVQRVGRLEFRILANRHDDNEAIAAADRFFQAAAKDWKDYVGRIRTEFPKIAEDERGLRTSDDVALGDRKDLETVIKKRHPEVDAARIHQVAEKNWRPGAQLRELLRREQAGLPPPPPGTPEGKTFKVQLEDGEHRVTYAWVGLGKSELDQLHLNSDAEKQDRTRFLGAAWWAARAARNRGELFESFRVLNDIDGPSTNPILGTSLSWRSVIFSRKLLTEDRLPPKERDKEKYEYFLLTRDPEPGKAVTNEYFNGVKKELGIRGRPAVGFRFNAKGAALFKELTTANRPPRDAGGRRHIAIVLDGVIESAPSLPAVISESGVFEGRFTDAEVAHLVNLLRSGALPATLKPVPVSETTVGPRKP